MCTPSGSDFARCWEQTENRAYALDAETSTALLPLHLSWAVIPPRGNLFRSPLCPRLYTRHQAEVTWHKARATAMKKKVTIARQHAFPRAATSASTTAAPAASVPELDRGKRLGELDDDAGDDADAGDEIVVNASRSPHVKTDPGRQVRPLLSCMQLLL